MNIIERNFYRLLRAGAFATEESIEPLSAWKWRRLYQLSEMHDVASIVWQGVVRCSDQFFLQLPAELYEEWSHPQPHDEDEENDLLTADKLTNPLLNHKLQNILDSEDSNMETRKALLHLLGIARFVMNAGIPVKRVTEFGLFLRESTSHVNFTELEQWVSQLHLDTMTQLTAVMLVKLLHFAPEELPFMKPMVDEKMESQLKEMFRQKNSHAEDWYFSQGKNIFVHSSNSQAMLWHVRRSTKYFRYYPAETVTNFFTSFAHSLSHIEE